MMRGLLACCLMFAAACSTPAAKPTFDLAGMKPTPDGETATLTGWFNLVDRTFRLYPTAAKPANDAPCLSGVLLSLAGMPTPEDSNRPMTVTGYVYAKGDEAAQGAANPCQSGVILEAIEVSAPET
jgi:hypothetical protein